MILKFPSFNAKNALLRSVADIPRKMAISAGLIFGLGAMQTAIAGTLTVNVNNSTGSALTAAKFKVWKGPNYVGEFSAGSTVSLITGSTYTMFAHYDGTSTKRETFVSDAGGDTYNFSTTSVTFHFSGGYLDFKTSGSWSSFGKTGGAWNTRELFPRDFSGNIMEIHTGYAWNDVRGLNFTINYEGLTSIEKTIAVIRVRDHNNDPISGAVCRGGTSTPTSWFVSGSTNSDGLLLDLRNGNQTSLAYEAKVNNTTSWVGPQNPSSNSYFLFQTVQVTLKLETCAGNPLSGGTARYGYNSTYGSWYFPAPNSTDGNGESNAEFFPGTYSFEMNYQTTSNVKSSVTIPNSNTTLTWKTTTVTLSWPYDIAYGGNGDSRYFNKPSMELLEGDVNFNFRGAGNNYVSLHISGCSTANKGMLVKLLNSSGSGIAGGVVDYYAGGWHNGVATTNGSGNAFVLIPGSVSSAYFRMGYANATQQLGSYNLSTTPSVTFQTKNVTVELRNSGGALYNTEGSNVQYYSGGWHQFGSGTTASGTCNMELLPVSYYFRLTYAYQTQQQGSLNTASMGASPLVTFQTLDITTELRDSDGDLYDTEGENVQYYAGGWYTFGTGTTSSGACNAELLPGSYYFRLTYKGQTQQKGSINLNSSQTIAFNTNAVTLRLKDAAGTGTHNATGLGYYAGGWKQFGSGYTSGGEETMELLPGSYYFRMTYKNQSQQKGSMSISSDSVIDFQTVVVTLRLKDAAGTGTHDATDLGYYAGGWNQFGCGNTTGGEESMELLPGSYYFRLTYAYQSQQKGSMSVTASQDVEFQTEMVSMSLTDGANGVSGGSAEYYAGGWHTFGSTDGNGDAFLELLPGSYYFRMSYSTYTKQKGSYNVPSVTNIPFVYTAGVGVSRIAMKQVEPLTDKMGTASDAKYQSIAAPVVASKEVAADKRNIETAVDQLVCFPNPVVNSATVSYVLSSDMNVSVSIYGANGQLIQTLNSGMQAQGLHTSTIDASTLSGGMYFVKVVTGDEQKTIRISVNK